MVRLTWKLGGRLRERMVGVGTTPDQLERGREASARHAWGEAYSQLSTADGTAPLGSADLESLAMAAYLTGRDAESVEILSRAHQEALAADDTEHAVRCTFWIGFQLINKGDMAQAGGWFARGRRLLETTGLDCVEQGYMLVPAALQHLFGGDFSPAFAILGEVAEISDRFGDVDLKTLSGLGRGQALIGQGKTAEGMALLDEAMIAVTTGEASAIVSGLVYCGVIAACHDAFDVRRAHEWTEALSHWCAARPDLVPYRGVCLIHRAELLQLRGAWSEAIGESERACKQLAAAPDRGAVGAAFYQLGEVQRLRGNFSEAEEAYRQATQWGRSPHPGLAQLRLAQGEVESAKAAIRNVVSETADILGRSKVLPAYVEIMLAAGDVNEARAAAEELSEMAAGIDAAFLDAIAAQARGAVSLAEGDARAALAELRIASGLWQEFDVPHESARSRLLIGLAYRALRDEDTAEMEFGAARSAFQQLGAAPDLARADSLVQATPQPAQGLTGREVQVLALVATGMTNREIATDLFISEKTVARHVANIFTKLAVTTRAAATAYAFKHDLV